MADVHGRIRDFWDADSHTYDEAKSHAISDRLEAAAWRQALLEALPEVPAKVLDAGAGTGALSLLAAELGHQVTALDLSSGMLASTGQGEAGGRRVGRHSSSAHYQPPRTRRRDNAILWTLLTPFSLGGGIYCSSCSSKACGARANPTGRGYGDAVRGICVSATITTPPTLMRSSPCSLSPACPRRYL
jgi:SAM-dependent methyltransferase